MKNTFNSFKSYFYGKPEAERVTGAIINLSNTPITIGGKTAKTAETALVTNSVVNSLYVGAAITIVAAALLSGRNKNHSTDNNAEKTKLIIENGI